MTDIWPFYTLCTNLALLGLLALIVQALWDIGDTIRRLK